MYNTEYYNSRTGLFASAATHTAMARRTLLPHVLIQLFSHIVHHHTTKVCPSYIYTYVTFWLFTFVVLMGLTLRLFYKHSLPSWMYTQNRFPINSVPNFRLVDCRLPPTGGTYPNKLPLHSCGRKSVSPVFCRQTLSLSIGRFFVSMSDPLSSVWIFSRINSPSSSLSRNQ